MHGYKRYHKPNIQRKISTAFLIRKYKIDLIFKYIYELQFFHRHLENGAIAFGYENPAFLRDVTLAETIPKTKTFFNRREALYATAM